jgi:Uma2 family endonuclease
MATNPNTLLTPEEYLELDRKAEVRSEYYDGEIFPVEAATREHGVIVANLVMELGPQLKGKPCDIYPGGMRVRVKPRGPYTYPDIVVVCGERTFADDGTDSLLNPTVLLEVLSPSTGDYDRSGKFEYYRGIPSLREYLTVAQDKIHIEYHVRQSENRWLLTDCSDRAQRVVLPSINCTLALSEVYYNIEF